MLFNKSSLINYTPFHKLSLIKSLIIYTIHCLSSQVLVIACACDRNPPTEAALLSLHSPQKGAFLPAGFLSDRKKIYPPED